MEDFAQQITCNFNKSDKNENTTCIFSKLFILDEDKHGVNFIGTMLQFLLNSDNFLEKVIILIFNSFLQLCFKVLVVTDMIPTIVVTYSS